MPQLSLIHHDDLTDEQYELVSDTVYKHCGINLQDGKKELVRSRLSKLLRKHHKTSYAEYINEVLADPDGPGFSEFINSLTTNLTNFFREPHHFAFLTEHIIPKLVHSNTANSRFRVRCWSAGCSSGEEPYSIGMLLHSEIPNINRWDVKILATDISSSILDKAKNGVYDKGRVADVPDALKLRYISKAPHEPDRVQVSSDIKRIIAFKYLNLIQQWPVKGPFDFIFCRNVMIYFDKQTQQRLINNFWNVLSPGGILFTGHSESLTGIKHSFKYVQPTIYVKA